MKGGREAGRKRRRGEKGRKNGGREGKLAGKRNK